MIRRLSFSLCMLAILLPSVAMGGGLAALLPESIGDLIRVQFIAGPDAQVEVDKLHGKALAAEESAIARYARPGERPAEVWVSRVADEAEARRQTGLMVHKMYENPKSPFKDPSRVDHSGRAVYRFIGMGQAHLIWFGDDLVWWVSASPGDEAAFLDAFCR
jgi:hypothetical protein